MKAFLLCAVGWGAVAFGGMAPESKGKVFVGPEGSTVSVVFLKPRKDRKALVAFEGTDSDFDGRVLLHQITEQRQGTEYSTQWEGRGWTSLVGTPEFRMHLPGKAQPIHLKFDGTRTDALEVTQVVDRFLNRKRSPQPFDAAQEKAKEEERFKASLAAMNEACKTTVGGEIAWDSVKEKVLKSMDLAGACGAPLAALERLCDDEVGRETVKAKVKRFRCQLGSKLALKLAGGGALEWVTAEEAPDQEPFAKQYLENNL